MGKVRVVLGVLLAVFLVCAGSCFAAEAGSEINGLWKELA